MRLVYYILIGILTVSCSASSHLKSVKYRFKEDTAIMVLGRVPDKWIDVTKIEIHNKDFDIEYQYTYSDSSIFYISNAKTFSFPNYDNIKNLGTPEGSLRLQDDYYVTETNKILIEDGKEPLPQAPHTVDLSGKDHNGLFWRDIKYGDISIGYLGVAVEKKDVYDIALESFHLKP